MAEKRLDHKSNVLDNRERLYYQSFDDHIHQHDKVIACHADSDTKKILPLIKEAGFDMVECIVTAAMLSVALEEACTIFQNRLIIWGGIPSTIICEPYSEIGHYPCYQIKNGSICYENSLLGDCN